MQGAVGQACVQGLAWRHQGRAYRSKCFSNKHRWHTSGRSGDGGDGESRAHVLQRMGMGLNGTRRAGGMPHKP